MLHQILVVVFSRQALAEFLDLSDKTDSVFLAGNFGKNSETTLMLESFINKYTGLLFISSSAIESFNNLKSMIQRPDTVIFVSLNQLRNIAIILKSEIPITSDIGKPRLAEALKILGKEAKAMIVLVKDKEIWTVKNSNVCECKNLGFSEAKSVVWATQQSNKIFKAIISSCIQIY